MNLASLPLLLHSLFQIHVLSTPANFLLIPVFSYVVFPLVLIGVGVGTWWPLIAQGCNTGLTWFGALTNWLGSLPGLLTIGRWPTILTWLCLLLTLILVDQTTWRGRRRYLRLLCCCYGLGMVALHYPLDGEVSFLDIGQGDSVLVRTPFNRHVSLIDTGGHLTFRKPQWAQSETGSATVTRVTVNYLHSRGITTIDDVNCSHQDADHIGDVGVLLQQMRVKRLTIPAGMRMSRGFQTKIAPYLGRTTVLELTAGQHIPNFPFTVYHPFHAGTGENADSVVLGTIQQGTRFLFMGDLDRAGERQVIEQYPTLQTDVLKVGHHGSDTASDPEFITHVRPKFGIISAGRKNRYGHPKAQTLMTLANHHVTAVSTADVGMISYTYLWWERVGHWQTMLPVTTPQAGSP
ncbi:hypothetical protein OKN36_03980 [Furfurilactobacillus sp. OKN36]